MPRLYTVEFEAQTVAAASGDIDLFSLDAATDKPIELVEVHLGQTTELGDTAEEQLRIRYIRGHTTVGSGGASATPQPPSANDAASGATTRTLDTTIASAGTAVNLASEAWNLRGPYDWGPRPQGMGFWTSGSAILVVRLMAAVADDITASGWCSFYEYP
jgi:hypothetical protein